MNIILTCNEQLQKVLSRRHIKMDQDTIFMYYINEYSESRFCDILNDMISHKKDIDNYTDFLWAFFRLELDFIENYLVISYKETFI